MDPEVMFLRGKEAADRGNFSYAVTIFLDILRMAPKHRKSRIALRGCEMELFREHGGGAKARILAFFKGFGLLITMHLQGGKPAKVMDACERYLVNDPTSAYVLRRLSVAYEALGCQEAALDTLEFARQRHPQNTTLLKTLGELQYRMGEYEKAVRSYQEITRINPENRDAIQRGKEISAESHLKRSKMEQSSGFRDQLRDGDKAAQLERDSHIVRSTDERQEAIERLKQAAEKSPESAEAFMALGDAYFQAELYNEAEPAYRRAFEISKRYPAREKMGTTRIRRLELNERKAEEAAKESGGDPTLVVAAREAKQKRLEFCIKEYDFRRKQHPTDMRLAFQLGQYYLALGGEENLQQAIQQFQQAMSSSALRLRAQTMLGRCMAMNPKTLDMAREQFIKALGSVEDPASDMAKELTYEIAEVTEKLGNSSEALDWYKKIYVIDASYRDVSKKVQQLD